MGISFWTPCTIFTKYHELYKIIYRMHLLTIDVWLLNPYTLFLLRVMGAFKKLNLNTSKSLVIVIVATFNGPLHGSVSLVMSGAT